MRSVLVPMHGLGGGADLPVPASIAVPGAVGALVLSFVVLLLAWRTSRFDNGEHEMPVPAPAARLLDSRGWALVVRALGFVFFLFMLWPGLLGPDLVANPTFGVVYVLLWVGIVPSSLLFGRFYRAVSPVRTLHLLWAKVIETPPERGLATYPERLGYWPAAAGLFAFVWLELVAPESTHLGTVRLWFSLYALTCVGGAVVFGDKWLERADPFETYSNLVAKLSPWGRDDRNRLVLVSPLRNLATLKPEAGLVAVVATLLGSTAYDSFRDSATWARFVQDSAIDESILKTTVLLLAVGVVGGVFAAAARAMGAQSREKPFPANALAHSVIPIIVGYMVAHYLSFFVQTGQLTLSQLSDPLVNGSNLFGTANLDVNYWLSYHTTALATIKVLAIVIGHVAGAVAAHDRALQLLPTKVQVTGQLPLLAAMVAYTYLGLYLLFGS